VALLGDQPSAKEHAQDLLIESKSTALTLKAERWSYNQR